MSLEDLEPRLVKIEDAEHWRHDITFAEADGLWFLCPKCYIANGWSDVGTHAVLCWQPHVGQEHAPRPGRWRMIGEGLHDVSLVAGSSSILLQGGCGAHFYVRAGAIVDMDGFP